MPSGRRKVRASIRVRNVRVTPAQNAHELTLLLASDPRETQPVRGWSSGIPLDDETLESAVGDIKVLGAIVEIPRRKRHGRVVLELQGARSDGAISGDDVPVGLVEPEADIGSPEGIRERGRRGKRAGHRDRA